MGLQSQNVITVMKRTMSCRMTRHRFSSCYIPGGWPTDTLHVVEILYVIFMRGKYQVY